jgi:hypothetical protein
MPRDITALVALVDASSFRHGRIWPGHPRLWVALPPCIEVVDSPAMPVGDGVAAITEG